MQFTILTNEGPVAADRKPVWQAEYPNTAAAKSAVESGFVPPMKRGWTAQWNMPKKNSIWVYVITNSKGKVVHKITLKRGSKHSEAATPAKKAAKKSGGANPRKAAAKSSKPRGNAGNGVAKKGGRPKIVKKGREDHRNIVVGEGQSVEITVHAGGSLLIKFN